MRHGFQEGNPIKERPDAQARLLAFLNDPAPLASCRHCVSTNGIRRPHAMTGRRGWAADLDRPPAEMVDHAFLESSLREKTIVDDCGVEVRSAPTFLERARRRVRRLTSALSESSRP